MMVIVRDQAPDKIEELWPPLRMCGIHGLHRRPGHLGGHWPWSWRYGLEDGVSILSAGLDRDGLIYIYPLKAIFGSMWYLLSDGRIGKRGANGSESAGILVYGIGFTAMACEILLLYCAPGSCARRCA